MWNDSLVVDGVTHAYEWIPENRADGITDEEYHGVLDFFYRHTHYRTEKNDPAWMLNFEEFTKKFTADAVAQIYIEETDVDLIVYHEVQIAGFFKNGTSPWETGVELKERYPDRVMLYAFADPFNGEAGLAHMEEQAATGLVDGFKFYPTNGVFNLETGHMNTMLYDDPELAFPFLQKALDLGVKHVGVHKAFPVAPGPLLKDRPDDIGFAAEAFPELTFEIVHSGWAFLDECALQLMLNPNVYANLELTANFAVRRPRQCLEAIGTMLRVGDVSDRLIFATGIPNGHPQPVLEAFSQMQMPADLVEGQDMPELTDEIKEKILGGNFLAMHGIDAEEKKRQIAGDEWDQRRQAARERGDDGVHWRAQREAAGTLVGAA
jgi:predicted TIM-barrel fold metal-dependent hydrolase